MRVQTLTGLLWILFYAFGIIFAGVVSYVVPDWRMLQLLTAIPALVVLACSWLIPESPHWYLVKKRKLQAVTETYMIARRNGGEWHKYTLKSERPSISQAPEAVGSVMDLFTDRILRKHTLVMLASWFSVSLAYYGIFYYTPIIPGGLHVNLIAGAAIEIPFETAAYFLVSWPVFGRRISSIVFQYSNAIAYICLVGIIFAPDYVVLKIVFGILGQVLAAAASLTLFVYNVELFPTVNRGTAIGICGLTHRLACILVPELLLLVSMQRQEELKC